MSGPAATPSAEAPSPDPRVEPGAEPATEPGAEGGLLRAAGLVGLLSILGSVLGFARDLAVATLFGASAGTDAFVVAWTIPETATPLLMEGALSALLIPIFSHDLVRRGSFREALGGLLVPLVGLLSLLTALTALGAPLIVAILSPGLAAPETAVRSVRVASLTILFLGLSGYLMSALRARNIFGWPGSVYIAYNVGILTTLFALHRTLGVFSAALGLAVGGACMILIQLPVFVRRVGLPRPTLRPPPELLERLGAFLPLVLYTIARQGQVYVERFVGSMLPIGTISHLNYASKVAQIPMLLSLTVALVTLPALSRAAAGGTRERLQSLVERNLRLVAFLIVPATGFLVAFAPQVITVLFEHGAFKAADASATAQILRVYTFGLLGQVLVGVAIQALVAVPGRTWRPVTAASLGLLLTAVVAPLVAPVLGAPGLALANALGITLMAVLMLFAMPSRGIAFDARGSTAYLARCVGATLVAAAVGLAGAGVMHAALGRGWLSTLAVLAVAGLLLSAVYLALSRLMGIGEAHEIVDAVRQRAGRAPRQAT